MKDDLGISRRIFLTGSLAMAGLAASGLRKMALAAEGSSFTFGRPRETVMYDPHTSTLSSSWHIQHMVYDTLIDLDEDFTPQPALATAWEWQGNTLAFTIRQGVRFANGREMTMHDVSASIERALGQKASPLGGLARHPKISTDGDRLLLEFQEYNAIALNVMAVSLASIIPMEEVEAGSFDPAAEMMMGTGPYRVTQHVANDRWVLEANPNYWGGEASIKTVIVRTIPSAQGLIAALRDGSIQAAMFDGNPDIPMLLAGAPNVEMKAQKSMDYIYLGMNGVSEGSPFTDERVRQAVSLCIDRQEIVDFAMAGTEQPTYGWTQFGLTDDSALPFFGRDIDRAKALLAEAGASNISATILVEKEITKLIAQIVAKNLAEIGINARIEGVDSGVWSKRVWGSRPSEMQMIVHNYTGYSHPLITAHWWAPQIATFTAGYVPEDKAYSDALEAAMTASPDDNGKALQALYDELNRFAIKVPLCTFSETIAWRSDRIEMSPSGRESQNDVLEGIETFTIRTEAG